ncbi:MAG: undecaprenyl/decaprenyl-phosphate alpha-N-acetylglucosaminyl 1-phosphate transferase [Acidobacteria bacterium]|nr:undecaprenyl/decaprenyl-phosphate alpha-N-acetylglucosaminyl 1-phosphate transferase [Acidobacteriota bacterium]
MNLSGQFATYGLLFVLSFAWVLLLVPHSARLAARLGAMDYPAERKIHRTPVPRLGGVAVFAAIWLAMLAGYVLNPDIRSGLTTLQGAVWGSALILLLGVYDDIRNASPSLKLSVQVVAAATAVMLGIKFELASNPLAESMRDYFDLGVLAIPLSILWIVGLTNAMNLIDGLDGLATGIAMFASIALFLISIRQEAGIVAFFYVTVAGATLAFLKFNRYPAQVFLGDSGSTFLGFLLACLSIRGGQKSYTLSALFIPLIVFGIPIFDTVAAVLRRYLTKNRIQEPDSHHIHHRLISAGLSQRQAVWILYSLTIVLGIVAFSFTALLDAYAAVIVFVIGLLSGFIAKEFNVFGRQRDPMERGFRYLEIQAAKEKGSELRE